VPAKKRKGTAKPKADATKPKAASKRKQKARRGRPASSTSLDTRVLKALSHPLRAEMLALLNDRVASPNELRKELEEGLSQVSYHIKVLRELEMIELVRTEPRRGAVEHYYAASEKVFITAEELKLIPKSARRGIWGPVLDDIEYDTNTSLAAGTFNRRGDFVVAREVEILDGQARTETEKLAAAFYKRYAELGVESDERRQNGEGDGEEIPTTAAMLVFDSVEGKNLKRPKKPPKK
jgi:DNA-binding transcriptional ArsR family regulator